MPEIVVIDLNTVTIDGETAGSVLDVAANYPQIEGIKGLVLTALQGWLTARDQAHADELANRDAQIAALGGTELAQQIATEARRQAALDAIAAAQAELASIDSGGAS